MDKIATDQTPNPRNPLSDSYILLAYLEGRAIGSPDHGRADKRETGAVEWKLGAHDW